MRDRNETRGKDSDDNDRKDRMNGSGSDSDRRRGGGSRMVLEQDSNGNVRMSLEGATKIAATAAAALAASMTLY